MNFKNPFFDGGTIEKRPLCVKPIAITTNIGFGLQLMPEIMCLGTIDEKSFSWCHGLCCE
jgi:hypothetical protein